PHSTCPRRSSHRSRSALPRRSDTLPSGTVSRGSGYLSVSPSPSARRAILTAVPGWAPRSPAASPFRPPSGCSNNSSRLPSHDKSAFHQARISARPRSPSPATPPARSVDPWSHPTNATPPSHPSLRTPRAGHPSSPRNSGCLRRFPPHTPAAPLHSCRSPVPHSTFPLRPFLPRFSRKTKSYRPPQTWDCTSSLPMRFAALLFRRGPTPTCPSFPPTSVTIFHPSPWRFPLLLLVRSLSVRVRHSVTSLSRYGTSLPCSCSCTSISRPGTMPP